MAAFNYTIVCANLFLWLLCGLCGLVTSTPRIYYITPNTHDADSCTVNNITLSPCYSFHQLAYDEVLLSTERSLALLLLPGTHMIPNLHTFMVSNLSELEIRPWHELEKKIVVECQLQADLVFQDISKFKVFSSRFVRCTLQFVQTPPLAGNGMESHVDIINCVFEDSKQNYAIVINGTQSELVFNVSGSNFTSNNGAILSTNPNVVSEAVLYMNLLITSTLFWGNWRADFGGGAVRVENVYLQLNKSQFAYNRAIDGGAISASDSVLLLHSSTFCENFAIEQGGSVLSKVSRIELYDCFFEGNLAGSSGGALAALGTLTFFPTALLIVNTIFHASYAESGGAAYISGMAVNFLSCEFKNNSAYSGGALYLNGRLETGFITNVSFISNKAQDDGGAMFCNNRKSTINIYLDAGYSISNSAGSKGGFACLSWCGISILNHNYEILSNEASNGGAVYAKNSDISFNFVTTVANNTAEENGGALYLINSKIDFDTTSQSVATFDHNVARSADGKGGAIFVLDSNCESISYPNQCFLVNLGKYKHIVFKSNNASRGSVLYGGLLDRCYTDLRYRPYPHMRLPGIDSIKQTSHYEQTPLSITSSPVRVCLCNEDYKPECNTRNLTVERMRGGVLNLIGTVVDQDEASLASTIRAGYNGSSAAAALGKGEGSIKVFDKCMKLTYHIFTRNTAATLTLQSEGYCERSQFSSITVHIVIVPCSRGFEQNNDRCVCERRLVNHFHITVCDIDTDTVTRKGSIWLRYDEQYLKVHFNCPMDYCNFTYETISLSSPDEQCANHRSGVICGACQDNHSIALGGSKCLPCTSSHTFIWLTLVFAVAGVALVTILLVFNLTISTGILNGLILYSNIVSISGLTSLNNCCIHPVLSVFIAWVNLDFGVEICFYPDMDTYQKTWLQFTFPFYIWLLVVAIIIASYYSSRAMKVFGRNNVAILATLFLLSYTKILKTIIVALHFTQVFQSDADNVSAQVETYYAWTYDGNIEYLKGRHVALFTVAMLLLIFLFLPYTLLLIFGQCLRSMSVRRRWVLWWIRSTAFISIMDAYHAPYNKRHRYWTGLMLLTRCVLFLAFASSYKDRDILARMYIVTLVIIGVLTLKTCTTKVYKNLYVNILELGFLLNLAILSATLHHLTSNGSSNSIICSCTSASFSLSLITFSGILAYHAYLRFEKTRCYTSIKHFLRAKWPRKQYHMTPIENVLPQSTARSFPTTTCVDLREQLLASTEN